MLNTSLIRGNYHFYVVFCTQRIDVVQTCLASYVHSQKFYGWCYKYNVDINICSIHLIRYAVNDHLSILFLMLTRDIRFTFLYF